MSTRARARRRRRGANLRYRPPRFNNRTRPPGWLPPSLRSRIGNMLTWSDHCCRWAPITRIEVERVKFDMQLMHNPEIAGLDYQQGTVVPPPYQAQGTHKGRVAVRRSGVFRINGVDSIPARFCTLLQRGDGYEYTYV